MRTDTRNINMFHTQSVCNDNKQGSRSNLRPCGSTLRTAMFLTNYVTLSRSGNVPSGSDGLRVVVENTTKQGNSMVSV